MRIFLILLMLGTMSLGGCATTVTGPGTTQAPPDPLEAQIMAKSIFTLSLYVAKLDHEKLVKLHSALEAGKATMSLALSKDPQLFHAAEEEFLKGLDPVFRSMVTDLMNITVLRLRPYINQEHPDAVLIDTYIKAVLDGALASTTLMLSITGGVTGLTFNSEYKSHNACRGSAQEISSGMKQLGDHLTWQGRSYKITQWKGDLFFDDCMHRVN